MRVAGSAKEMKHLTMHEYFGKWPSCILVNELELSEALNYTGRKAVLEIRTIFGATVKRNK